MRANRSKMKTAALIFPNQLFEHNPALIKNNLVYLIEESLFFKQYKFHKQKLLFHRSSMKSYQDYLERKKFKEQYIETNFQNLPKEIRKTNVGNDIVDYSITYSDNENIEITDFSANVKVILIDKFNKEIILERFFDFHGEKECYFSAH